MKAYTMKRMHRLVSRTAALAAGALAAMSVGVGVGVGANAATYDLEIKKIDVNITGRSREALSVNGQIPGPELRFKEGEDVVLKVTNKLDTDASIHWHGLILPYQMDGVPGISFPGIKPGKTFTYRFRANQSGTYWYHSHSGLQEQSGVYGSIVIEPAKREPFKYDREYVVLLSDWTDQNPATVLSNLKKQSDYYNNNQRTVATFFGDAMDKGLGATIEERLAWGGMRMTPTDIADVTGYTFLVNGKAPKQNWTALFKPDERIRLRFINGSAMTYFDVRIPGLKMTVVQADGNNVQPVPVDEFRIAVAETYDVIVRPEDDRAYTIVAESLDRTGFARGTLAPKKGMIGPEPKPRPRPLLTMADMGMEHGAMGHGSMAKADPSKPKNGASKGMSGMDHGSMAKMDHSKMAGGAQGSMSGMAHGGMPAAKKSDYAPNSGLKPTVPEGGKFLVYGDLKSMKPYGDYRAPDREIELKLTGNMERYFWSINGKKYSEADPIRLRYGERVRLKFVNKTMMNHPMHLHGMWMQLDNGAGKFSPLKHVVNVSPGTTLYVDVPVDALGQWAFHCHLLYHMATGMFRKVIVEKQTASLNTAGGVAK